MFFTGVIAFGGGSFGQGEGRIHLNNLLCMGNEQRLTDCRQLPNGTPPGECVHTGDVGVRCERKY